MHGSVRLDRHVAEGTHLPEVRRVAHANYCSMVSCTAPAVQSTAGGKGHISRHASLFRRPVTLVIIALSLAQEGEERSASNGICFYACNVTGCQGSVPKDWVGPFSGSYPLVAAITAPQAAAAKATKPKAAVHIAALCSLIDHLCFLSPSLSYLPAISDCFCVSYRILRLSGVSTKSAPHGRT